MSSPTNTPADAAGNTAYDQARKQPPTFRIWYITPAAKTVTCNNNNPCVATVAIADPATHKATVDPDKIVVEKSKRRRPSSRAGRSWSA